MSRLFPTIMVVLVLLIIGGTMVAFNPGFLDKVNPIKSHHDGANFSKGTIELRTSQGRRVFNVEIARTQEQRSTGLMNRDTLAPDTGMVFLFGKPRIVHMWMENMRIPLDIIFVDEHNQITRILEDIPPDSTETFSSKVPVIAAIEFNAGTASKYGMTNGDAIDFGDILKIPAEEENTQPGNSLDVNKLPKEITQ